ncbi:hypothetical protein [Chelativorans sp. Marseille-P2723]|uniref:hypothetical protein n=1 Tax=Chelativorans sp. Marseille-P2723 TaxID=2709133 RepID=UPI00156D5832|nr:hypothetical protein [Chelativorans sp. Marseille-P2723]
MTDAFSSFSQLGVSFDEIFVEGSAGGPDSLVRYLQTRRQMLLRDGSQFTLQGEDPAHFIRAVEVIDDALKLIEQLKLLNLRAALEEAARTPGEAS